MTGVPMIIVRLQGCDVGCPWCDTKASWDVRGGAELSVAEIIKDVAQAAKGHRWVLLTGGEPAIQPLQSLVTALKKAGFQTAIETSGTATGATRAKADWVCLSPKQDMPGGKPLLTEVIAIADEIKFVIGKRADLDLAERFLATHAIPRRAIVSVQPLSQSKTATGLCIAAAQQYGWRLSLQTHKLLGLP